MCVLRDTAEAETQEIQGGGMASDRKHKKIKWGAITWLVLALAVIVFSFFFLRFPLLPMKWKLVPEGIVLLLAAVLAFFSFKKEKRGKKKTAVSVINIFLAICLSIASFMFPGVTGSIEQVFADFPETTEITMNVYALTTQYKSAHTEQFREKGVSMITDPDLANYKNKQFITQSAVDQENQAWTLGQIKELFGTDTLWENNTDTIWHAVDALYNADGDVLVLNAAYVSTIAENEAYASFNEDTIILRTFTNSKETTAKVEKVDTEKPFAVVIAGSDSRDAALTTVTRTDVNIIAVVDPASASIMLVSIPRDCYMPNPALGGGMDKLTHMGMSGIDNTMAALSDFFGVELSSYALVNFNTYESIINTLGGVDIVNPYAFQGGGYYFESGNIHLSGAEALAYVRERYSLTNGDFDRNEHQIIVLQAMIRKMLTADVLMNFSDVMAALGGTFLTNVSMDSIYKLASSQLDNFRNWSITTRHVDGSTGGEECASMPGQLLSVVYPDEGITASIAQEMKDMLAGTGGQ